jgi:hypothetical protein
MTDDARKNVRIKSLAFKLAPRMATVITSVRGRRLSHHLVKKWGLFDLNQRLIADLGNRVIGGPFKDLILTSSSQREHIGPFLLGTYEMELSPWWRSLLQRRFRQIIDVGANFGYYAVGLARRFPSVPVVAFDTDWWARRTVRQMSRANQTPNVAVKGFCSPSWLARHLEPDAFIVSDCEGFEGRLFCDQRIAAFASATFVIELHETIVPGVTARIRSTFRGTHALEEIDSRSETPVTTISPSLTPQEMRQVAQEIRVPQTWFLLTPLGPAGAK